MRKEIQGECMYLSPGCGLVFVYNYIRDDQDFATVERPLSPPQGAARGE